jgi:Mg2+/Co2+ transporter CorB
MLYDIALLLLLLCLSGLFSGLETAFVAVSSIKARSLKDQGVKHGALLFTLKQNQRRLIITVLIGNNLVNIGASAYATFVMTQLFGSAGVGIATGVMTLLILTFGEILPKTFFAKHAEPIALKFSSFVYFLELGFLPVIFFFEKISDIFKIDNEVSTIIIERDIQTIIDVVA